MLRLCDFRNGHDHRRCRWFHSRYHVRWNHLPPRCMLLTNYLTENIITFFKQVVNVYMAKAPSNVTGWAGDGAVWFKVYQITAVTDGGTSITFPAQSMFMSLILKCHPIFTVTAIHQTSPVSVSHCRNHFQVVNTSVGDLYIS